MYEKACRGFSQILPIDSLSDSNLILNVEKTVFMPFTINKLVDNYDTISVHSCDSDKICNSQTCKILKKVEKIRYLGVIFDSNLR